MSPLHRGLLWLGLIAASTPAVLRLIPSAPGVPHHCPRARGVRVGGQAWVLCGEPADASVRRLVAAVAPRCSGPVASRSIAARTVPVGHELIIDAACTPAVRRLDVGRRLALGQRIEINQATVAELEKLPRIGPALARRIVDDRRRHGPYLRLDQLVRVSGIGPATVRRLRRFARVEPPPRRGESSPRGRQLR